MKVLFLLIFAYAFAIGATFSEMIAALKENNVPYMQQIIITSKDANLAAENKKSILMYSVWVGNSAAVNMLVARGADINAQDIDGKTALMLALYTQREEIAIFLINAGADLTLVSNDKQSALSMMGAKDKEELLQMLQK
ncbi:MAG: ankyrin repeat domain-containing protein [Sulfurimonas sp.]|nr:ankyrin repeat domain-containing protein [Sulfurimonas sp.]MDD3059726.1 ankyrin repeat domain-containing protein [Sulfurimonas sp.]